MARQKKFFGKSVKRSEDPRLLRGDGRYVADIKLHGMVHAAVLRSPHGHARIVSIDTKACEADARTVAVLTAGDVSSIPALPAIDAEPTTKPFNQPVLASDKARFVGEPVAVVVAEDRYIAEDLLGLIEVDYELLPPVMEPERAKEDDATILHDETNVAEVLRYSVGDEKALESAPHVIEGRFSTQRHAGTPLETRGVIAEWDQLREALKLWSSTQVPNIIRSILAAYLQLPEHSVRVIAPDVGGAFGVKLQVYPEDILVSILARRLGRPVKWIEDRTEHFLASTHGREQVAEIEAGYDDDGVILWINAHAITNTGAYLQSMTLVEPFVGVAFLRGPYRIPHFKGTSDVVMTNKAPMNPFRGVGHIQAVLAMERTIDTIARTLGLDPVEVRLRNMLEASELPSDRGVGNLLGGPVVYDSGDYPQCLRRAVELAGYEEFRAEQERLRGEGRHLGIGIACFVEETALGPFETASVRVETSGKVIVLTGAGPSGQGTATTLSQIVADELGVALEDIVVISGDTDLIHSGMGSYASRTAAVGGAAVRMAGGAARDKVLAVAAHLLEVSAADIELADGRAAVAGSPARFVSLADVAQAVAPGAPLPPGTDSHEIAETQHFHPEGNAFTSGTHIATVEVDIETGIVTPLRLVMVGDSGRIINPLLTDGQYHGGAALGIGGALLEEIVYDETGQPRNANLMDYLMPGVENMPELVIEHIEIPTPVNPDGVKGAGESGAIGTPAAIANAVSDALSPFGIGVNETPITPAKVFDLLVQAGVVQAG